MMTRSRCRPSPLRPAVLALMALIVAGSAGAAQAWSAGAGGRAARTISLNESARLHLTSKHNFTLNERGTAMGTAAGTIYVHLTAVSSSRVTVEVNIYPRGGSLSGFGQGSYRRSGATVEFSGSMAIGRGTGSYGRIHGSGLGFTGTIAESDRDAITVHVSGRVAD